ncbi:Nudix family hydrolase [Stenotrophobium rhamnosiphilum]|uniref:Nudix family hydrolase n=1 Tax=Stenotrophobium rhamnosiphilum TaxID=2029166 RepID=UPI001374D71F|nr:Nudix family hydrolase [Stenotrophobium rhamnosiphilum]
MIRRSIAVAAGCIVNAAGEVLIAQRPEGKIAAGKWEFPGGKIEVGERADQALVRELEEELGVHASAFRPLVRITHDYSDRKVVLDTWLVTAFSGEPHGREQQAFAWVRPERLFDYPLLGADGPIVASLRLPQDYVFTPEGIDEAALVSGLPLLPKGALLRLRQPALSDAAYKALAGRLAPACKRLGLLLMLDRDPAMVAELGAAGWHASAAALSAQTSRPLAEEFWFAASVHNEAELAQAQKAGADFLVVGSVNPTPSHPQGKVLGWSGFAALADQANRPVYAIGGVRPRDREQAFAHYAQGVAGISAYWSVPSSS